MGLPILERRSSYKNRAQALPIDECVFDVVAGGVDEDATLIPGATLDSHVLVDSAQVLQFTVAYGHG